ncbi:hypothetical protein [Gemmatimonas sp.]|jgi:hypothetical protein|uniref:hypothetical protein n=1 Tax=Gemmatimonas sp. TaxID=1962908 RepID=UPI0037BE4A9A
MAYDLATTNTGASIDEADDRAPQAPAAACGGSAAEPPLPSVATRRAEIQAFMREIPMLDPRPAAAMLGHDNFGLPN